ncbi:hypothetical protein ACNKHO_25585 [Shigella flexneri]
MAGRHGKKGVILRLTDLVYAARR